MAIESDAKFMDRMWKHKCSPEGYVVRWDDFVRLYNMASLAVKPVNKSAEDHE